MPEWARCARIEVQAQDEVAPVADRLAGIALEHSRNRLRASMPSLVLLATRSLVR
jgi:hypothetical protein